MEKNKNSLSIWKTQRVEELVRVYLDLEKTLKQLRSTYDRNSDVSLKQIDVQKLIRQLSHSKKRLERKIGNTLLLEKQQLERRLKAIVSSGLRKRKASASKRTNSPTAH